MSEFKFSCTRCGQHLSATAAHSGMIVKCPSCQADLQVPAAPATAAPSLRVSGMAPPLPEAPPVIAAFRPSQPVSARAKGNRGLIIGLIIGGCLLVFLVLGAIAAWMFVGSIKREIQNQRMATRVERPFPPVPLTPPGPGKSPSRVMPMPNRTAPDTDVTSVEIASTPAAGTLGNQPFKVTTAKLENGNLTLAQGNAFIPDQQVLIFLFLKTGESTSGKTILVPDSGNPGITPHVHVRWKENTVGQAQAVSGDYVMRLEFGPRQGSKQPGKIYLELPTEMGCKLSGTFVATVK